MSVVFIAILATLVGFLLIVVNRRPPAYLPATRTGESISDEDRALLATLTLEELGALCRTLVLEKMGLTIEHFEAIGPDEIEIRGRDHKPVAGGIYMVHAFLRSPGDYLSPTEVVSSYSVAREEGAIKGIVVTSGEFSAAASQSLEGEKMELIDGTALLRLCGRPASRAV